MPNKKIAKGRVQWQTTMSLDGFIAGPENDMDWIFKYSYPDSIMNKIIKSIGALLVGRNTYNVGQRSQEGPKTEAYGGAWSGPVFILPHKPPVKIKDEKKIFVHEPIKVAIIRALQAAKG